MTNTEKATPRPWHYVKDQEKYHLFPTKGGMQIDYKMTKADADLIVRAVNSFEALLEACKEALKHIDWSHPKGLEFKSTLEQAIAKAEQEG